MELKTHLKIDTSLSGEVINLKENFAEVVLKTTPLMVADSYGLIHGGFIFSAADFAAMAAVNHKNVVLGSSEVKFLKPVKLGDIVNFIAKTVKIEGKKHYVEVEAFVKDTKVFEGKFLTFVLEKHILS